MLSAIASLEIFKLFSKTRDPHLCAKMRNSHLFYREWAPHFSLKAWAPHLWDLRFKVTTQESRSLSDG